LTNLFYGEYTRHTITFGIHAMEKIRVIIGHGHPVISEGLSRILAEEEDIEVVATTTDGEEAARMAKELRPDVAVIDIVMPKLNGIQVAKQIKADSPTTAILMLSEYRYGANVLPSLRAGALGYMLENCPLSELISAIHLVHDGERVFAPKAAADILYRLSARHDTEGRLVDVLHDRELEILKLVTKGLHNKDIANKLGISERTVQTHLINIFRKLGVNSRTEAVVEVLRKGWISLDEMA
jgi:DNA-binding NarL/FixJ family response regulator